MAKLGDRFVEGCVHRLAEFADGVRSGADVIAERERYARQLAANVDVVEEVLGRRTRPRLVFAGGR